MYYCRYYQVVKRLLIFFAILSIFGTVYSQTPVFSVASYRKDFPELMGDQVITRVYKGTHTITHFRHKNDTYNHSFMIQGGLLVVPKRIQANINASIYSDTLYRLTVNDMRIEGDSCYFCGNVTRVGPSMITPQGNTIWPQRDPVGCVGYFSITELLEGHVYLKYQFFYDVHDLTRMAVVHPSSQPLMVAAIGTLSDKTTPCVLELKKMTNGSWTKSLGYPNSVDEVFSDILYNPTRLVIASYRRSNSDEGEYQDNPNPWRFTLHYSSASGFCSDFGLGTESAAEYDTYALTVDHNIGWHTSDVRLRLCRLAGGRTCMAYGTKNTNNQTAVILFSMPNEPISADTITNFWNGFLDSSVVHDIIGLPYDNSVAIIASAGTSMDEYEQGYMFFPTISTPLLWVQYVPMYGVLKRSVDRWDAHTAISGGYQSVYDINHDTNIIVNLLQDKRALYPTTSPPITCFSTDAANHTATESLYADKGVYDWNRVYYFKELNWRTHICDATSVIYENTCTKVFSFSENE